MHNLAQWFQIRGQIEANSLIACTRKLLPDQWSVVSEHPIKPPCKGFNLIYLILIEFCFLMSASKLTAFFTKTSTSQLQKETPTPAPSKDNGNEGPRPARCSLDCCDLSQPTPVRLNIPKEATYREYEKRKRYFQNDWLAKYEWFVLCHTSAKAFCLTQWRTRIAWVWHESDKLSARPAGMSCTAICRHHRTSKNGIEAFTSYNRRIQQLEGSGPSSELLDPVNQRWGPILLPKFQLHFLIFNLLPKFLFHFQNFDHLRIYTALRLGYAHE